MSHSSNELFKLREARPDDVAFIYSTWLRGLYYGNELFNEIPKRTFFDNYKGIVTGYLTKASVLVACLPDDEDVVLGYSVSRGVILDWVFVKKSWRKMGIARSLVSKELTVCSHLTGIGKSLKPKDMVFNPFV